MIYLEDLGPHPLPVSIPWLRAFSDPLSGPIPLNVEGYRAAEQILKNLSVRWCRWVRSVFFLFVSIKNVPGKVRHLSLCVQYSYAWLEQRLKNTAPDSVEGYREWSFLYSEVGTANEA